MSTAGDLCLDVIMDADPVPQQTAIKLEIQELRIFSPRSVSRLTKQAANCAAAAVF